MCGYENYATCNAFRPNNMFVSAIVRVLGGRIIVEPVLTSRCKKAKEINMVVRYAITNQDVSSYKYNFGR